METETTKDGTVTIRTEVTNFMNTLTKIDNLKTELKEKCKQIRARPDYSPEFILDEELQIRDDLNIKIDDSVAKAKRSLETITTLFTDINPILGTSDDSEQKVIHIHYLNIQLLTFFLLYSIMKNSKLS